MVACIIFEYFSNKINISPDFHHECIQESESNGFLHADSITFLHQIANNCAADKGIPTDAIFNYFLKGLSFSLQKSIANSIQYKLSNRCSVNSAFNQSAILLAAEDHV